MAEHRRDHGEIGADRLLVRRFGRAVATAVRAHDLTRAELMAVQRGIQRLDRSGKAPTPNEFWETTAWPRAQVLLDTAIATVDVELRSIELVLLSPADQATVLPPTLGSDLVAALPPVRALTIGPWWQRRLRRAAVVRALPSVVVHLPGEAELLVAHHEMHLADRAPWVHGDRLLSAFELAHHELHRRASAEIGRLTRRVRTRSCSVAGLR